MRHASHWTFSNDAPIMLTIIDTEEQSRKPISDSDAMVEESLVAISRVEMTRTSRAAEKAQETASGKAQ